MEVDDKKPSEKPVKGYSKRPVWQWIVIYLIVAIVVYGIIYYVFINGGDSSSNGSLGY